ncbi:hypothetical protein WN943_015773 [Citrus x changshan-huyou]
MVPPITIMMFKCLFTSLSQVDSSHYRCAKDILEKEMLPHVPMTEFSRTKKAYYFG